MRSYAFCVKRIEDAYVYYSVVRKKEVVSKCLDYHGELSFRLAKMPDSVAVLYMVGLKPASQSSEPFLRTGENMP